MGDWKVVGALDKPNKSVKNWYKPYTVEKAFFPPLKLCRQGNVTVALG